MPFANGHALAMAQPAIANLDRKILAGPQYLDELVVSNAGNNVALVYMAPDGNILTLTYGSIYRASLALAVRIQEILGPSGRSNTIIPVILPQQPILYLSYLAALRSGAAFCPILPDTPDDRLQFIVHDVQAKLVICAPERLQHTQGLLPSVHCVPVALNQCLDSNIGPRTDQKLFRDPSDIAYVMYTSGSTGQPKGVPVSHRAVTQSLLAHDEHIPPFKRFFQFAAPTFDVSVFEIFFPWFRGAILACAEREATLADLPGTIRRLSVDAIELTPTVVTTLLRRREAVSNLTLLLTIGEMLNPQIIQEFGDSESQAGILFAMYGPTEAAIHCTIAPRMKASSSVSDIGRPFSTVTAFILQESGDSSKPEILHRGQSGELAISGQLASGYLNRNEQTKAAFIDLPGHGVVYRTGDRAVMLADGSLQIQGRISGGQIKLRGQRVELGEIESVALQATGVELAVAMVVQDTLVLFCSGHPNTQSIDIENRCKSWLPRHMRPGRILVLEKGMPRLPSGKIDRKKLENLYSDCYGLTNTENSSDSHTATAWITAIISEELAKMLNVNQSLWSSGLDSLRAIAVASRLRERYPGVSISMVLEAESISSLTALLEAQLEETQHHELQSQRDLVNDQKNDLTEHLVKGHGLSETADSVKVVPCSAMQNAMLAETCRDPLLNFNKIVLKAKASVSYDEILVAFQKMSRISPILGAGFEATGDSTVPFVQVNRTPNFSFQEHPSLRHPLQIRKAEADSEFIVVIHHALYDGWSWDLVMKDLNVLLNGGNLQTRPSYETFSILKSQRSETRQEEDLMSWTTLLQGVKSPSFPTLHTPRPEEPGRQSYSTVLTASTEFLSAIALDLHVNKAVIVHSAICSLLSVYLDTNEILTGLVLAGREPVMPDVGEVIGPCLMTLPLLARFAQGQTLRDLILQAYQQYKYCLRQSSVSLSDITNALSVAPGNRLFEVLFVWQEPFHPHDLTLDKVTTAVTYDYLDYPILIECECIEGRVHLKTTFDTSKLSTKQVQCMHSQLDTLVDCFTTSLESHVWDTWDNLREPDMSISKNCPVRMDSTDLMRWLTDKASEVPQQIAIDFVKDFDPKTQMADRDTITYQELRQRSLNVASRLVNDFGLTKNEIVAIHCSKSPELYVLICATLLAGVAYLCIDPNSPQARILEILEQAKPKLFVAETSKEYSFRYPSGLRAFTIDEIFAYQETEISNFEVHSSGSDLAYAVFTSGSTGTPKGVLITRENIACNLRHLSTVYPFSSTSRLLQSCSQAFDVSVFEIFWTWTCGMTLCAASNDVLFRDIEKLINTLNISHLSMTPSLAALVQPKNVPNVNFLVCAGEPMSAKVFESWMNRGLHQGYGPSETTNICNVRHYRDEPAVINNIGPAFPNTSIFVCRRRAFSRKDLALSIADFKILPRGAVGEIWIGGQQVGRGYTSPELTRQSFLDHPEYGRLFKSGDFGRLLPDDSLLILGREDDQVKIRGQRIELNEINSRLIQSGHVRDSFTLVLSTEPGRRKLVSFWVQKQPKIHKPSAIMGVLFDHLHSKLPAYMIPECLLPVSDLPLTSQGKVDKRALTAIHAKLTHEELAMYSPNHAPLMIDRSLTPAEMQILGVLADMVHVPTSEINVYASFFSHGIDSIQAISFARKLQNAGFSTVEVSDVLRYPSIHRLASRLTNQTRIQNSKYRVSANEVIPEEAFQDVKKRMDACGFRVAKVLPTTSLQAAMLSHSEGQEPQAYVNHLKYRLAEEPDMIRRAWAAMVKRHDLLRTIFVLTDLTDYPYIQIVLEDIEMPWLESADGSFDILNSPFERPLYKLRLVKSSSCTDLHLLIHHALYDAEALALLHTEIELYCLDEKLPVPQPFTAYLDYMLNIDQRKSHQFWKNSLRGVVPCHLSKNTNQREYRSISSTRKKLCNLSWTKLSSSAQRISVTPLVILQVALARLLAGHTRATDICFGTVFSGRNLNISNVDGIVGPCFNTLPVRVRFNQMQTNDDLCQILHAWNVSVLPYQASSLRQLQGEYSPNRMPLFDVMLLLQAPIQSLDPKIWSLVHEQAQMVFPYIFEAQPNVDTDELHLLLHSTASSSNVTLDGLLEEYASIITDLIDQLHLSSLHGLHPRSSESQPDGETDHELVGERRPSANILINQNDSVSRKVVDKLQLLAKGKLPKLDSNTTIFHVGLDSISAIQLASQLRRDGFNISGSDILERPRISEVIQLCEDRKEKQNLHSVRYDIDDFNRKHYENVTRQLKTNSDQAQAVWPCTSTQIGILSEYTKSSGRHYFNSMQFRMDANVDLVRLHEALKAAIKLHVMLRTGFVEIEDTQVPYAMIVYSDTDPDIRFLKLPIDECQNQAASPNDLSRPPWYIELWDSEEGHHIKLNILHALYDAHSLRIIFRDFSALLRGADVPEPPSVPTAISNIVANNYDAAFVTDFVKQNQLQPPVTRFPDLNILRQVPSKLLTEVIGIKFGEKIIDARCKSLGCSLSTACQVAWAQLLAAYTGQQHVAFGTVFSGRSFDVGELNDVAFPCINTLPIFVNVDQEATLMIEGTAKLNAHWHRNPHISLAKVKNSLGIEGDLFDTLIVLQKYPFGDHTPWQLESEAAEVEYTVSLEILPNANEIQLLLTYDQSYLPREHSPILLRQYENFLYQLLGLEGTASIKDSPLVSARRARCDVIPSSHSCLHELALGTAAQYPGKIALEYITRLSADSIERQTWTYQQLQCEAGKVADLLLECGCSTGDMVALCCEKCPQASFALLGILMAGCTYVAIDPDSPAPRREFILEDARCEVLLTTSSLAKKFKIRPGLKTFFIDNPDVFFSQRSRFGPNRIKPSPENVCYCLYTSGTTGVPKGCLISHGSAVQAMMSFSRIFEGHWTGDSKWLQFAAYHFDVSVLEHFWSWKEGLCVTVIPRDLLFEDLPGIINRTGITHLDLTPSLARLLTPQTVPSLCRGVFIVGGEQVRQDVIESWGDAGCLYNFYGPSEVTIGCTVHPRVQANVRPTNIGNQWDNIGTRVFQPGTQIPVPLGAVGELCLSGVLVGKGYLNRQQLTREKFVVLEETGERAYRTGDLVRMLHDGSLDFLGRIDDQVKLRGQRLEIGEINHVILSHSAGFQDASALVSEHPDQEKQHLVAFLALGKDARRNREKPTILQDRVDLLDITKLRYQLSEHLPAYMIPTYFVLVDFLPLTINNKIDTKMLRDLYKKTPLADLRRQQEQSGSRVQIKPKTYKKLINSIAKYLQITPGLISQHESLFQLGLDSISAIGLARSLKKDGFVEASVAILLKKPIISDLAATLCAAGKFETENAHTEQDEASRRILEFASQNALTVKRFLLLADGSIEQIVPCTPLQEGMISRLMTSESKRPPYMTKFVFRLEASTDITRLTMAWDQLQTRNSILRTLFVPTDNGYSQVVLARAEGSVLKLDCGIDCVQGNPLATISKSFESWAQSARHLGRTLPWEAWFTERDGGRIRYMSLFMFHGLYDGISIKLLLEQLHRFYRGDTIISETPQFHSILQFGPLLQRNRASDFWTHRLPHIQLLGLSFKTNVHPTTPHLLHCELLIPEVRQASLSLNVTPQAIFQAAWLLILSRQFDCNPTIGIVLSGRTAEFEDAERVIGPMLNTLPFASAFSEPGSCFADLVKSCHEMFVEVLPYQHTSLSSIRKWLKIPSDRELFDSLFVYQNTTQAEKDSLQPWVEVQSESDNTIDYPLNIEIQESGIDGYVITVATSTHSLSAEATAKLLESFKRILENLPEAMQEPLPPLFSNLSHRNVGSFGDDIGAGPDQASQSENWTDESETIRTVLMDLTGARKSDIQLRSPTIFELGLDSVDALKLAARLGSHNITLPVSKILQNPTVAGIATQCGPVQATQFSAESARSLLGDKKQVWRTALEQQNISVNAGDVILPTTPLQEGLLLAYENYFHTIVLRVNEEADAKRIVRAIHDTIQGFSILRTRFVINTSSEDNGFLQIAVQPSSDEPESRLVHRVRDEDALKLHITQLHKNAGVSNSTPQVSMVCLEDGSNYILLALSHASYDAWSLKLILHHMQRFYHGGHSVSDDQWSIAKYIESLRVQESQTEAQNFWSEQLSDITPCLVKHTDSGRALPALLKRKISCVSADQVQTQCRLNGVTLQSMGVAVWTLFLMTIVRQIDVAMGVVVSGRIDEKTENLVFPTFNTIIFRPRLSLDFNKRQVLEKLHQQNVNIFAYQQFPLTKALGMARNNGEDPFNTLFTFQRSPTVELAERPLFDEVDLDELPISPPYAVNVEMQLVDGNLVWTIASQAGVMSEQDVSDAFRSLDQILKFLVSPEEGNVFQVNDAGVSVCGLSPFQVTDQSGRFSQKDPARDLEIPAQSDAVWSGIESVIRSVFSEVSGTDPAEIAKDTSIYHIGLDSVSAIRLSKHLRDQGLAVPVSAILKGQTIARITSLLEPVKTPETARKIEKDTGWSFKNRVSSFASLLRSTGISDDEIENILPATGGQLYMLDMWRASRGRLFYATFFFEVRNCSLDRFTAAFQEVVREVPALRTTFILNGGKCYQVIFKASSLRHGPVRLETIQQGDRLFAGLNIHHALYDAVSLSLIVQRLQTHCSGGTVTDMGLDKLVTNQVPFIKLVQDGKSEARDFWTRYISGAGHKIKPEGSFELPRAEVFVPEGLSVAKLEELGRENGLSVQAIFFATLAQVIDRSQPGPEGKQSNTTVIGVYLANRSLDLEGLPDLAAPTFNVVPLKIRTGVSTNMLDVAREVQVDLQEVSKPQHCGVSLKDIHSWTGLAIDCYVNFLRLPDNETEIGTSERETGTGVVIRHADGEARGQARRLISNDAGISPFVDDEALDEEIGWCLPAVDVEAKVDENGNLALGIFAAGGLMNEEEARNFVEQLQSMLIEVGEVG